MNKFFRNYSLAVQASPPSNEIIIIKPPFTIEFDITRNISGSLNNGNIRIYNLGLNTRNKIRKDAWDSDLFRTVVLQAGYGDGPNFPTIFTGSITHAWSVREGDNFITEIQAFDGGFASQNSNSAVQVPKGTFVEDIINSLVGDLAKLGVSPGQIGRYNGQIARGNSYSGNTADILKEITGGGFFIDNGKAHCLRDSECVEGEIKIINSASGLLGTPIRENTILTFPILFEPRLIAGQIIQLQSITGANYNGFYKTSVLHHRGTISQAVAGDAITEVTVIYGTEQLTVVPVS